MRCGGRTGSTAWAWSWTMRGSASARRASPGPAWWPARWRRRCWTRCWPGWRARPGRGRGCRSGPMPATRLGRIRDLNRLELAGESVRRHWRRWRPPRRGLAGRGDRRVLAAGPAGSGSMNFRLAREHGQARRPGRARRPAPGYLLLRQVRGPARRAGCGSCRGAGAAPDLDPAVPACTPRRRGEGESGGANGRASARRSRLVSPYDTDARVRRKTRQGLDRVQGAHVRRPATSPMRPATARPWTCSPAPRPPRRR